MRSKIHCIMFVAKYSFKIDYPKIYLSPFRSQQGIRRCVCPSSDVSQKFQQIFSHFPKKERRELFPSDICSKHWWLPNQTFPWTRGNCFLLLIDVQCFDDGKLCYNFVCDVCLHEILDSVEQYLILPKTIQKHTFFLRQSANRMEHRWETRADPSSMSRLLFLHSSSSIGFCVKRPKNWRNYCRKTLHITKIYSGPQK